MGDPSEPHASGPYVTGCSMIHVASSTRQVFPLLFGKAELLRTPLQSRFWGCTPEFRSFGQRSPQSAFNLI